MCRGKVKIKQALSLDYKTKKYFWSTAGSNKQQNQANWKDY